VRKTEAIRPLVGLVALVLAAGARVAQGQCTYTALTSATAVTISTSPQPCSMNQNQLFYTGVAVRSAPGDDWNLEVYQTTAAFPACVATLLAGSSAASGVDFLVGDFFTGHNPTGTYYPLVTRASGAGNATVEWDDGGGTVNLITVNGALINRTTGPTDVIEVWNVSLSAGSTYTFTFNPSGANLKLLLFKSGPGVYWAGRGGALFEVTTTTTYTAAASGFYGVVVINDDGAAGSYSLGVGQCDAPEVLFSGTSALTPTGRVVKYYSIHQTMTFWTAVGARGTSNWNVEVYGQSSGGAFPVCFSNLLAASSLAAPAVDFVVADFNEKGVKDFYARVHLDQGVGSGQARVEWDDGGTLADILVVDDPAINRTTDATDVLETWDLYLETGTTYNFILTGGSNIKLFLFNPLLDWGTRSDAVLEIAGSGGSVPYAAPDTGYYGVVVVNENGASGSYSLQVTSSTVGVDEVSSFSTALRGVSPNPARGEVRIHFSLRDPGTVSFEVHDVAGRLVAKVPAAEWGPGRWIVPWTPRASSGARLASGVYFVRMSAAGRTVALRKFILLD